jgi:hypothetical protein
MSHPFLIAALVFSRYIVNAFWRKGERGVRLLSTATADELTESPKIDVEKTEDAKFVAAFLSLFWWAALSYSVWKFVPRSHFLIAVVAALAFSRYIVNAIWRSALRGVHGSFTLEVARTFALASVLLWWSALTYSVWRFVP